MAVGFKKTVQIRMVWFSVLAVIGFLGTSEKFRTLNRDGLCDQYWGYLTKPPDTLLKIAGLFLYPVEIPGSWVTVGEFGNAQSLIVQTRFISRGTQGHALAAMSGCDMAI
jgi:hypothetical protein